MSTLLAAFLIGASSLSADDGYQYRFTMIRAAPGNLLELIDLLGRRDAARTAAGDRASFMMRHSQGDQWDLLVVTPVGTMGEYFGDDRVQTRNEVSAATTPRIDSLTAWREDVYVTGPELDVVGRHFEDWDYYHVEMMVSLPGKRAELYEERVMENRYSAAVGRPENLIFDRVTGAAWEVITIGFYRDIQHFAEGTPDLTDEDLNAAAVAAGFEARDRIGTYLRSLLSYHHDTLAGAVGR